MQIVWDLGEATVDDVRAAQPEQARSGALARLQALQASCQPFERKTCRSFAHADHSSVQYGPLAA